MDLNTFDKVYRWNGMTSHADGAPCVNPRMHNNAQVAQVDRVMDHHAAFCASVVVAYAHVEITCF